MEAHAQLIKDEHPRGTIVEFHATSDPYSKLQPGTKGEVKFVDSMGTVHVDWDDGSCLGMIPGEDSWTILPRR